MHKYNTRLQQKMREKAAEILRDNTPEPLTEHNLRRMVTQEALDTLMDALVDSNRDPEDPHRRERLHSAQGWYNELMECQGRDERILVSVTPNGLGTHIVWQYGQTQEVPPARDSPAASVPLEALTPTHQDHPARLPSAEAYGDDGQSLSYASAEVNSHGGRSLSVVPTIIFDHTHGSQSQSQSQVSVKNLEDDEGMSRSSGLESIEATSRALSEVPTEIVEDDMNYDSMATPSHLVPTEILDSGTINNGEENVMAPPSRTTEDVQDERPLTPTQRRLLRRRTIVQAPRRLRRTRALEGDATLTALNWHNGAPSGGGVAGLSTPGTARVASEGPFREPRHASSNNEAGPSTRPNSISRRHVQYGVRQPNRTGRRLQEEPTEILPGQVNSQQTVMPRRTLIVEGEPRFPQPPGCVIHRYQNADEQWVNEYLGLTEEQLMEILRDSSNKENIL